MKTEIIKSLVKVANSLDQKGLYKESDIIDSLILKLKKATNIKKIAQDSVKPLEIFNLKWTIPYGDPNVEILFNLKVDGELLRNPQSDNGKWAANIYTFSWDDALRSIGYVISQAIEETTGEEIEIEEYQVEQAMNRTEASKLESAINNAK